MTREPATAQEVCSGFLREDAAATRIVRSWIAGAVRRSALRLSDPDAAVQESYVRLLEAARAGKIRPGAGFRSLVLTVTRHHCLDVFRHERLRERTERPDPALELRSAADRDPHESFEREERLDLLRFVFQALPVECRRMWHWVYGEGRSAAEIADRLGISTVNARVRLHRCLRRAREIARGHVWEREG